MCVSMPGQVVSIRGPMAEVRHRDRNSWFNSLLVPGLDVGAWVFTQANLVMAEVSAEQARDAFSALEELERELARDTRTDSSQNRGEVKS